MFLPACSKSFEDKLELFTINRVLENSHLHGLGVLKIEAVLKSRTFSSHPLTAIRTKFVSVMY